MKGQGARDRSSWRGRGTAASIVAGVVLGAGISSAPGFPRYNDGCQDCHGAFNDAMSPRGTVFPQGGKHIMHNGAAYMDTDCNLCHSAGDDHNPFTYLSDGTPDTPGLGCVGCHGREYGGGIGVTGAGLRAHHAQHGVGLCGACHYDDPAPLAESVAPPYYGSPDTNVDDPCNGAPLFLENWSLDPDNTLGLDNDGDDLYDADDPDCSQAACPWDCDGSGDGQVAINDLIALLGQWGAAGTCDVDGGGVAVTDLIALLGHWGPCP